MKRGNRILVLSVLSLFVLSIFAVAFVSAITSDDASATPLSSGKTTLWQDIVSGVSKLGIGSLSSGWLVNGLSSSSSEGVILARILIFFLVTLIVYSLGDFLPFIGNKSGINFVISVIVGIFSSVFLTPADVETAVFTYPVLGVILTAIIPFFAIASVVMKSNDKHPFLGKMLWVAFIIYLVLRLLFVVETGWLVRLIYLIMLVVAVFMFLFGDAIANRVGRRRTSQILAGSARTTMMSAKEQRMDALKAQLKAGVYEVGKKRRDVEAELYELEGKG